MLQGVGGVEGHLRGPWSLYPLYVCVFRPFSRVRLFATLWTIARQAPLSMEAPGKSGLPCCPPGDLPDPGIEPLPELQANSLLLSHQGSPCIPWAPSVPVPVSPTSSCQDHFPNLSQGRAADGACGKNIGNVRQGR